MNGIVIRQRLLADHQLELAAHDEQGHALARAQLHGRIGLSTPRHWYHVGQVVHAAPELGLFRAQRTLLLGSDLTGQAELCAFQGGDGPRLTEAWGVLARAAMQAAQADPARWGDGLFAELPGAGPAFWAGLTRHFFRGDPQEAAARLGPAWRCHVAALLPRQPVYVSFLPADAQAAIGGHAEAAQALHDGLHAAGLRWRKHVTIDDGAAVLEA